MGTVSNNNQVSHTPSVDRLWPAKMDLRMSGKSIKLIKQNTFVQKAISDAFTVLHTSLIFDNTFLDGVLAPSFVRRALLTATSHMPNGSGLEIRKRILIDLEYYSKISLLVCLITFRWIVCSHM